MTIDEIKELLEWESERAEKRGQEKQQTAEAIKDLLKEVTENKGEEK